MSVQPNPDQLRQAMIGMLYQALIFLVSFCLIIVIGIVLYSLWGSQISSWGGNRAPAVTETAQEKQRQAALADEADEVVNGVHVATGLIAAEGFEAVRVTCTACHSAKLVTQNRNTREGWEGLIRWMQETQGLWKLGDQEKVILDYLAANYAPQETGRRPGLDLQAIEWYLLEE